MIGSGVTLLDLSRWGSGDKSLCLLINCVLAVPSDWGVILLERLVVEPFSGDSLDLDFLL